MSKKELFTSDVELLNSQSNYKKSLVSYILSNTALSLLFKILASYLLSLLMIFFGLFENYAFLYAYIMVEVVLYNLNDDILKP